MSGGAYVEGGQAESLSGQDINHAARLWLIPSEPLVSQSSTDLWSPAKYVDGLLFAVTQGRLAGKGDAESETLSDLRACHYAIAGKPINRRTSANKMPVCGAICFVYEYGRIEVFLFTLIANTMFIGVCSHDC